MVVCFYNRLFLSVFLCNKNKLITYKDLNPGFGPVQQADVSPLLFQQAKDQRQQNDKEQQGDNDPEIESRVDQQV